MGALLGPSPACKPKASTCGCLLPSFSLFGQSGWYNFLSGDTSPKSDWFNLFPFYLKFSILFLISRMLKYKDSVYIRFYKNLQKWYLYESKKDILPFFLNTKGPLRNMWLLRYLANNLINKLELSWGSVQAETAYSSLVRWTLVWKECWGVKNVVSTCA